MDEEHVAQLTAEKAIRKWVKGRGAARECMKLRERNEALDLEVYCLAALYILGPQVIRALPQRATRLAARSVSESVLVTAAPAAGVRSPASRKASGKGWVRRWRG